MAALIERWGARDVVDLAAGTGKLTRILARHADVIARVLHPGRRLAVL